MVAVTCERATIDANPLVPDAPRIAGEGIAEARWRASAWLSGLPVLAPGTWLEGRQRLVVVAPHPDDEVLGVGGLLAMAREAGIAVAVVAVTDGEACYPDLPAWTPEHTRAVRRRELAAALACLGVDADAITALDLGDGRVAAAEDRLVAALDRLLEPGDCLLTTWIGDGHPDHEACARAARAIAARRRVRRVEFPIWAWHWLEPTTAAQHWPGACRWPLTATARRAKARALACFRSQLDTGVPGRAPILPSRVLARFRRGFELLLP